MPPVQIFKKALPLSILSSAIFFVLFLTASPALATTPTPTPKLEDKWSAAAQTTFTLDNLLCSMLVLVAGQCPYSEFQPARVYNPDTKKTELTLLQGTPGGGAIGGMTTVMAALYTPPTSTAQYLADLGQDFGLAQPVYAQSGVSGSGEGIIRPVKLLWQATRNIAYLAFIIIFLIVGFMIMFRQKISQQAVVTAQAALPGLVVGLILVTFSYFLSALIIDLSFVGIQLVAQIFNQVTIGGRVLNIFDINNLAQNSNVLQMFLASGLRLENIAEVSSGSLETIGSALPFGLGSIGWVVTAVVGGIIGFFTLGLAGAIVGAAGGAGIHLIIGLIVPLILVIALAIQFVRLLLKLISAYITILVFVVTGPFVILFSSLPGKGGTLSFWWKTLLGNALVFPAVFAAFLFAGMILATDPNTWAASPPLFAGLSTKLLRIIIAYGIILGSPAVPDMVKKALGVQDIQGIPQEALGGFQAGRSVAGELGGGIRRWGMQRVRRSVNVGNLGWLGGTMERVERDHPDWLVRPQRR